MLPMTTRKPVSMALRLSVLALAAFAAVGIAVLLAAPGDERGAADRPDPPSELRGVPQSGIALGDPHAPVTLVEFADLQCPFCREYHGQVFPTLLEYVKSGRVRLELNLLRFIGPDSNRLARTAAAAAAAGRMWNVVDLAYARQGPENSGYADDPFLEALVSDAGLESLDTDSGAEKVLAAAETRAHRAKIDSTPSFLVGPTGGALRHFHPDALTPEPFVARLEEELRR
jgi:protein-disulfide isomerase